MKKLLLSLLCLLPFVVYAESYSDQLRELNGICPFDHKVGQLVSVTESNSVVTITYRISDNQSLNALKKLDSNAKTQDLLRDYLAQLQR